MKTQSFFWRNLQGAGWGQRIRDEVPFRIQVDDKLVENWSGEDLGCGESLWSNENSQLRVRIRAKAHSEGAVEFAVWVENPRDETSGLIALDDYFRLHWSLQPEEVPVVHHSGGGQEASGYPSASWEIRRTELIDGLPLDFSWAAIRIEGRHGRSSNEDLPIFLVMDENGLGGFGFAGGYSGNILGRIRRSVVDASVVAGFSVRDLRFRMSGRETVFLGSVLVVPFEGDEAFGKNRLRRVLRQDICPSLPGLSLPQVTYVHWYGISQFYDQDSLWEEAKLQADLGAEVFEVDAAWASQGENVHYGAGNWAREDRAKFPDGLAAFAERIRELGMRFGLWFEPETVEDGTIIHAEHPEWLIRADKGYRHLLDFGIPEARAYITEVVSARIAECGVEWIRMDSNLNPEAFWAMIPDPGERGMRELRHWEGCYRFLDELLERHPGLHLEGCSSGGRRINLEMLKRSHSFWFSDNSWSAATVHQNLSGANHFLPSHLLNMQAVRFQFFWDEVRKAPRAGDWRDVFPDFWLFSLCGGLFGLGGPHTLIDAAGNRRFADLIRFYKRIRMNLNGDFYPLLPQPRTGADWDAWQFHNPDTGGGHIVIFRMRGSRNEWTLRARALDPGQSYELESFPCGTVGLRTGDQLKTEGLPVVLNDHYSAKIIRYHPVRG